MLHTSPGRYFGVWHRCQKPISNASVGPDAGGGARGRGSGAGQASVLRPGSPVAVSGAEIYSVGLQRPQAAEGKKQSEGRAA